MRHNFDLSTDDYTNGEHSYTDDCLLLDSFEVHTLFEDSSTVHSNKAGDDDWGPLDNLKPASKTAGSGDFSVKAKYSKVKLGVSHLPMYQPGSKEYEAACKRMQLFHDKTHIKDAGKIEKMIVTNRETGLRPGDSRYPYKCDKCYRAIDTVQRKHTSVEQGKARAPENLRPGEKWMVDGGDATVRSKWGSYRYFLLFTCAKTSYIIIYYLKDNSARAYVAALKYVDRLVRLRKGYGVKTLYGDFFSTHLDQNVLGALRADLGIEFEVTPPYMHWLNGYAEVYMRVMKIATRVRLLQMIGKYLDDVRITDSTDMWPFAMEHARQSKCAEPSTTIEKDTGTFATREQMFREDTETPIKFHLHPFGTRCYVIIQKSQRYSAMTDTAEACLYLMGAGYNPFSHTFVDASQAHIVLRSGNRLQITGRVIFPYMKGDPDPPSDSTSAAPAPFTDSVGDPQIPAAVQASEQNTPNPGLPLETQFRTWPNAPSPLRQLPSVFDRWNRRDPPGHVVIAPASGPPIPLPPPEPPPATDVTRVQQSSSDRSIPMTLRAAPSAQPSTQVVVPNPALVSVPLLGPGRSRYPTPYTSPSTPAAAPAPTPAAAPAPTPAPAPAPSAHEPTVLPDPSGLRRSSRTPATRTPMNLSRLGMGEDPVLSSTEFDGVFPVGETHTTDPPESSEVPNRFVLQLTSIAEEPPEHERPDVCYNVEDIPIGTRDVLRDHLAAACAHELHMTQEEWNMVTTYLSTVNNKPRRRSHSRTDKHKSSIGESRASDSYGHNVDVDETVLDALVTQYMFSDHAPEVIMLTEQVNADGLVVKIEEQKLADLKNVPVEQHQSMLQAIAKEFNDLIAIGTFTGIEVPTNRKAISSRIVLKVKHRADGAFDKYKARLVARGFLQKLGVDFFSTFSPMATLTSIRILLAIAVHNGLDIVHADIPQAFLKARLDTDIWLQLPPGITFKDKDGKILKCVKLIRSLYGLRDSPSNFNKELVRFMKSAGFKQLECDKCIFFHFDEATKKFVLVGCEVDDLIITGNDTACIARFKKKLVDDYNVTDWERIASFLGVNMDYDLDSGVLAMDVKSKIEKLFEDHSILNTL